MSKKDRNSLAIPLVVAVTGHRDLVASEVPMIRQLVLDMLKGLADQYPDRRLSVMSPLAEGADQLVAEVALELGIDLTVPLPIFEDHPMYGGLPDPGDPDSAYSGHDHPGQMWCGDQAAVLAAWLAIQ